mgnify:CR=1 FL=1
MSIRQIAGTTLALLILFAISAPRAAAQMIDEGTAISAEATDQLVIFDESAVTGDEPPIMAINPSASAASDDGDTGPQLLPFPVDMILNPGGGGARLSIGLLGGVTAMSHAGEFVLTEETDTCCRFDGGSGIGPMIALRAEFTPDADGIIAFGLRLSWQEEGGEFEGSPEVLPIFGANNEPEDLTSQGTLDISAQTIDIAPLVMIKVLDADLFVTLGPSFATTISSQSDLTEQIVSPDGVTYLDGTTERFRGDLPAALVADSRFSALGGLDLRLPITNDLTFAAEALYRLGLTPFGEDDDWTASGIVGGIGIFYGFGL